MDLLLVLAQTSPIQSAAASAQDALSKGNEQQILAYACVALGIVIVMLSGFIVKQWRDFKAELREVADSHAKQLTVAYERLDKEQDDRRVEVGTLLRSALEAQQVNSASLSKNTEAMDRLARLIETHPK